MPVRQKVGVRLQVGLVDSFYVGADQIFFCRNMYADLFVPDAFYLHPHLCAAEIKFDIKDTVLPDKIFFLYPDRRNDKANACFADIRGLARKRKGRRTKIAGRLFPG